VKLAILESPYAGNVRRNVAYARRCLAELLREGYAPIASHLLYPQVLDDVAPDERRLGIDAGLAWRKVADVSFFYAGMGWSRGMLEALALAKAESRPYVVRDGEEP
jgi:hypothetical protein